MKTLPNLSLTTLAAVLAAPISAQSADAHVVADRVLLRFEIDAALDADIAFVLLSPTPATAPTCFGPALVDAETLYLSRRCRDQWIVDLAPVAHFDGCYCQPVLVDAARGVSLGSVDAIQIADRIEVADRIESADRSEAADRIGQPTADTIALPGGPYDSASGHDGSLDALPTSTVDAVGAPGQDTAPPDELPIRLSLEPKGSGTVVLTASFEAPSSDYGLTLVGARLDGGETTDVYLYRKWPGPGEGLLDVTEVHRVSVELPADEPIQVFLAQGLTDQPGSFNVWQRIAKLP